MTGLQWDAFDASKQELNKRLGELQTRLNRINTEVAAMSKSVSTSTALEDGEALAAYYRSGRAGSVLQELQQRVDEGEFTWGDVWSGKAGALISEAHRTALAETSGIQVLRQELHDGYTRGLSTDEMVAELEKKYPDPEKETEAAEEHWRAGERQIVSYFDDEDEDEQPAPPVRRTPPPARAVEDDEDDDLAGRDWFRRD